MSFNLENYKKLEVLNRQIEILLLFYHLKVFYNLKERIANMVDELPSKYEVDGKIIKRDIVTILNMFNTKKRKGDGTIRTSYLNNLKPLHDLLVKYIALYFYINKIDSLFLGIEIGYHVFYVDKINTVITAIKNNTLIKLSYTKGLQRTTDRIVIPKKIIINKSKLGFLAIHNSLIETYDFTSVISIKNTDKHDASDYSDIITNFLEKHLFPCSIIKTKIVTISKYFLDGFEISEIITNKIDDDGQEKEISHFTLDQFADWVLDEYWPIQVVDLDMITKYSDDNSLLGIKLDFKKYNTSYKIKKVENSKLSCSRHNLYSQKSIPSQLNLDKSINIPDESSSQIRKKRDFNNMFPDNMNSCILGLDDLTRYTRIKYDSIEIEIPVSDIYTYTEPEFTLREWFRNWRLYRKIKNM